MTPSPGAPPNDDAGERSGSRAGRTTLIIVTIVGVLVILLVGIIVTHHKLEDDTSTATDRKLPSARAYEMAAHLRSGSPAEFAKAVMLPRGVRVPRAALQALSVLRSVSFDVGSFRNLGGGTAFIRATVVTAKGVKQAWRATLVYDRGTWKLAETTTTTRAAP